MNWPLAYFMVYRLASIVCIQTAYVPDEYWQSVEIAHKYAFGYGDLTWEHESRLRSLLYPSIYYVLFLILRTLNLDSNFAVVYFPRIIQAVFSAIADLLFFRICMSFQIKSSLIFLAVMSDWFLFYCGSRTLINTFETNLIVCGLYFFSNFNSVKSHLIIFASVVCFSVFVRPTSLIIWGPFCFHWFLFTSYPTRFSISLTFFKAGVIVSCICILLDSFFYRALSITPLIFLKFNVYYGISSFYGSHSFFWYLGQGLPTVSGIMTIPFVLGAFEITKNILKGGKRRSIDLFNGRLLFAIVFSLFVYSSIPHKEFRFILPLSPMINFIGLQYLNNKVRIKKWERRITCGFVSTFLILTIFFGLLHQRGPLPAMKILAREAELRPNDTSILFLMPCHSTPLYSHIHVPIVTRYIKCEPPLSPQVVDESEIFYSDPIKWTEDFLNDSKNVPSHIVMFSSLVPSIEKCLISNNYQEWVVIFHTWLFESRTGKYIVIYRRSQSKGIEK